MSKIQRALDQLDESLGKKPYPSATALKFRMVKEWIEDLWQDHPYMWWRNSVHMWCNIKFFWPHIKHMRDWDYNYQLRLFADSLEYLAKGLKRHNHCTMSERNYRRCLYAAHKLRKAYEDSGYNDKSYRALQKNNPTRFVKCKGDYFKMEHDYHISEEYYRKMFKLIHNRLEKVETQQKKEAWEFIHKYIQHFWD